jgi:hypothetical protein
MLLKQSILWMLVFGVCTTSSVALNESAEQSTSGGMTQSFTLYPPTDKDTGKYDESRACFSFKLGTNKLPNSVDWELGYGFAQISNEDWLTINTGRPDQRSVMKQLGKHTWADSIRVPALEPLPVLTEGQQREITIDASGGTHAAWANSTTHMAKATVGNMYLMHVVDDQADFYVLFRVEQLEQGAQCTISWRRIPNPEP